uniref:G-protein coupled receptors family 3 profile domain-containing protein n=1 Tax=Amphimedon queenslandica TaxID=400682 RepID=A0A1X7VX46_AMPQE
MPLFLFLSIIVFSSGLAVKSHTYEHITEDGVLESFLCADKPLKEDTIVILSANFTHFISTASSFCLINSSSNYSLTLTSNSTQPAIVSCNSTNTSSVLPTTGFAFSNIRNLTLHKLVLRGCGGYLKGLVGLMKTINSTESSFYFSEYHSAVLLFLNIDTLHIMDIKIASYYGFALLFVNPVNVTGHCIAITASKSAQFISRHRKSPGSGIFLLFYDKWKIVFPNIFLDRMKLFTNFDDNYDITDLNDPKLFEKRIPVINAACLTVFFTQNFTVNVYISNSTIKRNYGSISGGALVLHSNSFTNSQVSITNTMFESNTGNKSYYCALHLAVLYKFNVKEHFYVKQTKILQPLYVYNSSFTGENIIFYDTIKSGAIYFAAYNPPDNKINVVLSNVKCNHINTLGKGYCLQANSNWRASCNIILENFLAKNNGNFLLLPIMESSTFMISNISNLVLSGSKNHYIRNYGSVFYLADTDVVLDGYFNFNNNNGGRGSVFFLYGTSRFYLVNGLRASFIKNNALLQGGAIYAAFDNCTKKCMCTFLLNSTHNNISINFIDNTATESGSSVYSTNLYNCYIKDEYYSAFKAKVLFHQISNGTLDTGLSTYTDKVCIFIDNECITFSDTISVYPGQTFAIPMAALDGLNHTVFSEVSLGLFKVLKSHLSQKTNRFFPIFSWSLSDSRQILNEGTFTVVQLTIQLRNETLNQIPHQESILLVQATTKSDINFSLPINLKTCPVGFEFNQEQQCKCSKAILKLQYPAKCAISYELNKNQKMFPNITISRPSTLTGWIGLLNTSLETNVFGVASTCSLYCNAIRNFNVFVIKENASIEIADIQNLGNSAPLCLEYREGPLCTQCFPGYSVTFSSNQCKRCSNWWLLTLIIYAAIGPLFIYILYALQLTLTTGTLYGIIFYAQIIVLFNNDSNYYQEMLLSMYYYRLTNGIISLINLNFDTGIPLCLYNGMTELVRSGLGLVFPIYLLLIVVGLIVASRYSVKLSNRISHSSVQVLVTVVHLSFTRLLTSVLDVFNSVEIFTNTTEVPLIVWYNDATVEYGRGNHLILMIITSLIVVPILLVYIIILIAGKLLLKIDSVREYIRPIYEAMHAPFKSNSEFSFSINVLFVSMIYIMYIRHFTASRLIPIGSVYFQIITFIHPFKKTYNNVLNFICIIVLSIVAVTWYYFNINGYNPTTALAIANSAIILMLTAVILSHISPFTRFIKRKKCYLTTKMQWLNHRSGTRAQCTSENNNFRQRQGSFFESCSEREPLLQMIND